MLIHNQYSPATPLLRVSSQSSAFSSARPLPAPVLTHVHACATNNTFQFAYQTIDLFLCLQI